MTTTGNTAIKNANEAGSPTNKFSSEAWGPLWLIHKYNGTRDKVDPRAWLVEFPMPVPGVKGTVRLKIRFERPLPEMEKWPVL